MNVRLVLLACLWIVFIGALSSLAALPAMDVWNGLMPAEPISYCRAFWLVMVAGTVLSLPAVANRHL